MLREELRSGGEVLHSPPVILPAALAVSVLGAAQAAPGAPPNAPWGEVTRYAYGVEGPGHSRSLEIVLVPSGAETVAIVPHELGSIPVGVAAVRAVRPARVVDDLHARLGPPHPSAIPSRLEDARLLAAAAAAVARAGKAFDASWSGPAAHAGSSWRHDGLTVQVGPPCEGMGLRGTTYSVMPPAPFTYDACVSGDSPLPLFVEVRRGGSPDRTLRLLSVSREALPDPAAVAGPWWGAASSQRYPGGVLLRADGAALSIARRRPFGGENDAGLPETFCVTDDLPERWWFDGRIVFLGDLPPAYPRAGTAKSLELTAAPAGATLRMLAEHGREHVRLDGQSRGACDFEGLPSLHDGLAASRALPGGSDLERRDDVGKTPLAWAAAGGRVALVRGLLRRGARVDVRDDAGIGPVAWAAHMGHLDVVKALVPKPPSSADVRDDVTHALALSAWGGRLDLLRYLASVGGEVNGCAARKGGAPHCAVPALVLAAREGKVEAAAWLLERGASLEAAITGLAQAEGLGSALAEAVARGHDDVAKLLLQRGAKPGYRGPSGPLEAGLLLLALRSGHASTAGRLAAARGLRALDAVEWCDAALLRPLLDLEGADRAAGSARPHMAALLQRAAACPDPGVTQALLDSGASAADGAGDAGPTALVRAVEAGSRDVVELLLARGARPTASAAAAAVAADRRDLHDLLVRAGSPRQDGGVSLRSPPASPPAELRGGFEQEPLAASPGFEPPRERSPDCVAAGIARLDPALRGHTETMRFAVGRDGRVSRFQALGAPSPFSDAVRAVVEGCGFVPGKDPSGRRTAMWVVMPVQRPVRP